MVPSIVLARNHSDLINISRLCRRNLSLKATLGKGKYRGDYDHAYHSVTRCPRLRPDPELPMIS
jgi:hypothetical protein